MVDHTATARIQRLVRWLEQFKRCFGHRAQLMALRTYIQGIFSDSERKSMQAMLARVTEPVSYQAFQHFITHAPWNAERVWRRLRAVIPERRGVLILDGHQLSETRAALGGRGPLVVWSPGQDRQLPSRDHGRALDRGATVVPRRGPVSAGELAHGRRSAVCGDPGRGRVSGKMATGADVAATGALAGFDLTAVIGAM